MRYRRVYIQGGSYFFTVVTEKRRKIFADDDNVKRLRAAFKTVMEKRPFIVDAAVVLPDHLHFIWTLPEYDSDYSTRWRLIKTAFTKHTLTPLSFKMPTVKINTNKTYGNIAAGNIVCVMNRIFNAISIIFITTPLNTAMLIALVIGNIQVFTDI